MEIDQLMLLGK